MAAGGVVTSVVVESPSVDPSNAPPAVVTVATVGVSTALTDQMFNLQGRIVRSYEGRRPVCCRILDHLHKGHNALNPLRLAVQAITMQTLCQIHHMACLCLHHATNNASRAGSHDGWLST